MHRNVNSFIRNSPGFVKWLPLGSTKRTQGHNHDNKFQEHYDYYQETQDKIIGTGTYQIAECTIGEIDIQGEVGMHS